MNRIWRYIDIHSHIIPGIDDGASSMQEALKMFEIAYRQGIRAIIATPHYGKWNPEYNYEDAIKNFKAFEARAKKIHSDMKLYFGNEIYYSEGIVEDLRSGKAKTLGGTDYVLVEFSEEEDYDVIFAGLKEFVDAGYRPVLAHTERYRALQKNLKGVRKLIENGAYTQVNTVTFMGKLFDRRTSWSKNLLDEKLIHFIATDAHDFEHRQPIMTSAVNEMLRVAWEENVRSIVHDNMIKFIKNEAI